MGKKNLIEITATKNYRIWHRNGFVTGISHAGYEIHHAIPGKPGIARCCLKLLVRATPGHQNDWKWVEQIRKMYWPFYLEAKANFVKFLGCRVRLWSCCKWCKMPIIGEDK